MSSSVQTGAKQSGPFHGVCSRGKQKEVGLGGKAREKEMCVVLRRKRHKHKQGLENRVARWSIFIQKNPSLGIFWRSLGGQCWYICVHLVYFGHLVICVRLVYLCPFSIFVVIWFIFHVLVCCTAKNLATLVWQRRQINEEPSSRMRQS
jgi:hypothetical protein